MNHNDQDDLLEVAIRESAGGRIAGSIVDAVGHAYGRSTSRRFVSAAVSGWRALEAPQKVRAAAAAAAIAMVVNRAMALLGRPEPLAWILPVVVLVACGLIWALAVPIASEWGRLRR